MSRTLLFKQLRRAVRLAAASNQLQMEAGEMTQMYRAGMTDLSRRRVLQGLAAVGGALALGAPRPSFAGLSGSDAKVVIIGAGIAGLTAAYRLQQAGIRAQILEAQHRVGGRMFSIRNYFSNGQVAELGGELIDSTHTAIRGIAAELGVEFDDFKGTDTELIQEVWYFNGRQYSEEQIVHAFKPIAKLIARDISVIKDGTISYKNDQGAKALDRMTMTGWFNRYGISGWIREGLEVAYATEVGLSCDQQSALNLLLLIDSSPGDHFKIFGESDERFHVRGGNDLIIQGLAKKLDNQIETEMVVEAIKQKSDGGFEISASRQSVPQVIQATHVIMCAPATLVRKMQLDVAMPKLQREAYNAATYGTNAKLMIEFSERVWRTRHRSNGSAFTDLQMQTCWETSRLQPGSSGIITNFVGAAHGVEIGKGTAKEQAAKTVADMEKFFPGATAAREGMKEVRMHWPSNPWVLGSYMCPGPGWATKYSGILGEPVGRLYFAGEHTSMESQGYMNGGCESGERAAGEVLAGLGMTQKKAA
ncbi:MAG: FAD-dependent oxidoreductase [Pseudomonadota bacterium]